MHKRLQCAHNAREKQAKKTERVKYRLSFLKRIDDGMVVPDSGCSTACGGLATVKRHCAKLGIPFPKLRHSNVKFAFAGDGEAKAVGCVEVELRLRDVNGCVVTEKVKVHLIPGKTPILLSSAWLRSSKGSLLGFYEDMDVLHRHGTVFPVYRLANGLPLLDASGRGPREVLMSS